MMYTVKCDCCGSTEPEVNCRYSYRKRWVWRRFDYDSQGGHYTKLDLCEYCWTMIQKFTKKGNDAIAETKGGTMSHTPGPWKAKGSQVFDAGDNHLANAQGAWYPSPPPGIREQEYANARLIAAAPELLAALEYVRLILSVQSYNKSVNDDLLARIDAAIAKAKGE